MDRVQERARLCCINILNAQCWWVWPQRGSSLTSGSRGSSQVWA